MTNIVIYAQKGAVGGNVERVWGHEMQVCTIDSSNEEAVAAAKANGYSNNPNDIIEQIETQKLEAENEVMKGKLSSGDGNKRIKELEAEVKDLKAKLAIYEESKDVNGDGVVSYDEMTKDELKALLEQRDVEFVERDSKDALIQKAKDSE